MDDRLPPQLDLEPGGMPTVYRYYRASDKRLLYVGKTINPGRRGTQHRAGKEWWRDVGLVVFEHLPVGSTAQDLDQAERRAIGRGWPIENKLDNPRAVAELQAQYPAETDEHVFSYELVERFARYKPSTQGPVPLRKQDYRGHKGRVEVDRYPEHTRMGQDWARHQLPRSASASRPSLSPLMILALVLAAVLTIDVAVRVLG